MSDLKYLIAKMQVFMQYSPMLLHLFQPSLIQAEMQVWMWIFVQINLINWMMHTVVNWIAIAAASHTLLTSFSSSGDI